MSVTRRPGADHCGIAAAMSVIDGKWKVSLLWELEQAPRRFGELRRLVPGVSEKVLAAQLRELETDGIVHREVYDEVPPRVEYSLTPLGQDLNQALEALGEWGARHLLPGAPQAAAGRGSTQSASATAHSSPAEVASAVPTVYLRPEAVSSQA
ncbi:winged helix-turn-helix transcriptional regulator [Streptomyces sp. NPDC058646]|uniref:winged helix-turn-helix transcriptional regulator n=1 Tax=Streptomyces sp. NPDC058646 TaxID=3346574 RepID=UPI003646401D